MVTVRQASSPISGNRNNDGPSAFSSTSCGKLSLRSFAVTSKVMSEPSLGPSVVFTDPLSVASAPAGTDPNAVVATGTPVQVGGVGQTWTTDAAASGQIAQVVVSGENNVLNLGTGAADVQVVGGGNIIESIQLFDTATGAPIADVGKSFSLGNANVPFNGATVNVDTLVQGNSVAGPQVTIAEAAGNLVPADGFANYLLGGTGNDSMIGSSLNDFIRGGVGDDSIGAGAGNDLVRLGAGNDSVFLGQGEDTLYFTIDQVGAGATDFVTDFTTGQDKIAIDGNILYVINGNQITFTGLDGSTSTLTAQAGVTFGSASGPNADGIIFIS
jgi:Ca2+-binding RTX toxin-like protein